MISLRQKILCAFIISFIASSASLSQEAVTLSIKGKEGRIMQYQATAGGTLSFALDSLPLPNATLNGENLKASVTADVYFDTLLVEEEYLSYNLRVIMKNIVLGGLLQLPDFGQAGAAPQINLDITPQGTIDNIEIKDLKIPGLDMFKGAMPGMDDMGLDLSSLDAIMPLIVGLLPPIFPEDPIVVGDKWVQSPAEEGEEMPLPIFPVIEFRYKLEAIEDGIAKIIFQSKGKYDAGFINNFLSMVPEIPMGDDEMTIENVELVMKWDINGKMDFVVDEGLVKNLKADGTVNIDGGGKLLFTHEDGSSDAWEPKLTATLILESGLNYIGDVTREDFEALFPPPLPEEEGTEEEAAEETTEEP